MDSGGNLRGYIGDICRMGFLGEPDAELVNLLGEVETVQQAAFAQVRAGAAGAIMTRRVRRARRAPARNAGPAD